MSCRSEMDLLLLLLEAYKESICMKCYFGLCTEIALLSISGQINGDETILLRDIISKNKPPTDNEEAYWWPSKDTESRINFLQKLIDKYGR